MGIVSRSDDACPRLPLFTDLIICQCNAIHMLTSSFGLGGCLRSYYYIYNKNEFQSYIYPACAQLRFRNTPHTDVAVGATAMAVSRRRRPGSAASSKRRIVERVARSVDALSRPPMELECDNAGSTIACCVDVSVRIASCGYTVSAAASRGSESKTQVQPSKSGGPCYHVQ